MANQYVSMDNIRFTMFDVHKIERLFELARFSEMDKNAVNMLLDSVKDFSDKELYPVFREMDEKPAYWKDGKIWVHPAIATVMHHAGEMGLIGASFDYEDGGMQFPLSVMSGADFILAAANNNLTGYPGLTSGAADLLVTFANQEIKDTYVPKMISGEWGGTMCLTEPQAGSSLSDITSSASPQEDGSFLIKGQKIFISGGDHEYCDNFVHLVLARIDGAPEGTRGISLFVVPKHRLKEDGSLEHNDVATAADFQKMGQKGYCTTHLAFGDKDDCRGWLVGEANKGLKQMFQMMNGARIAVGRDATGVASAAYYSSLQYAMERPQGRKLTSAGKKDPNQDQTLIINHPDVRRMLFLQKAIVEGAFSLIMEASVYKDLEDTAQGEEKAMYNMLLEILTPIVKTFPAEKGKEAVDNGLQILGGYGFTSDFVLQQYYRDVRIMAIYEGTTGIQSLDLLGRKITMENGKALKLLAKEVMATIEEASTFDDLKPYAEVLGKKLSQNQQVLNFLVPFAMKGDYERFLADATIFMEFFSIIVIGWQWLKMATIAKQALVTGNHSYTTDFLEGKLHTMKFYYKYEMPKTDGLSQIIMDPEVLTVIGDKELIA
ncbi:MAG: acyl-CoA dehydrogenase [Bacteroidia bacterium]|nr:acyl-CoA dehydrogenase [Bacteroidia bacterium]